MKRPPEAARCNLRCRPSPRSADERASRPNGIRRTERRRYLWESHRSPRTSLTGNLAVVEFRYYNEKLAKKPKISVDGIVPVSLHFSHFKGNKTPPRYKADTGTEIALKVAED